jgi:hypothetical protein
MASEAQKLCDELKFHLLSSPAQLRVFRCKPKCARSREWIASSEQIPGLAHSRQSATVCVGLGPVTRLGSDGLEAD